MISYQHNHVQTSRLPLDRHQNGGSFVVNDSNETVVRNDLLAANHNNDNDTNINSSAMEKTISQRLNSIPTQERTAAADELHGVGINMVETPGMLQVKLDEMNQDLLSSWSSLHSHDDTVDYQKALKMDPEYVEGMKLVCLRADQYNSTKAAARLVAFFTFKKQLFGDDRLTRDIDIKDFQGDDRAALQKGPFQLLQKRDSAGRAIIIFVGSQAAECSLEAALRVFYFVVMTALRDEDTQKKGIVLILWTVSQSKFHINRPAKLARTLLCLPMRIAAIHICYNRKLMDLALKLFSHSMESQHLCRFRSHYGTYLQCGYFLMTFGIPSNALPIDKGTGEVDLRGHRAWVDSLTAGGDMIASNIHSNNGGRSTTLESDITDRIPVVEKVDLVKSSGVVVVNGNENILRENLLPGYLDPASATERLLSEKLNKMSIKERSAAVDDLHGVGEDLVETPEILQMKLQEMKKAISSLSHDDTVDYQKALKMDPEYVEGMKLLCLRADQYNSTKAAARLASFFTFKKQLFGDNRLTRDIDIEDFQGDDRAALQKGPFQLLQKRDSAGRAIIIFVGSQAAECSLEAALRVFYFVVMTALRDEDTQKKGIVLILWTVSQSKFHSNRPAKLARTLLCLPMRIAAIHICYNMKLMDLALKLFSHSMESQHLCRFRSHYGTYIECRYFLMAFGIPNNVLPIIEESGEVDLLGHHDWLENLGTTPRGLVGSGMQGANDTCARKPVESESILERGPMDILMGRGRYPLNMSANIKFRDYIESRADVYDRAEKFEKCVMVQVIFKDLRAMGFRFLRNTPSGLVVESDQAAKMKISHAFRNLRKAKRAGRRPA